MKVNRNLYPYNPDPERFPIYLTGIGGSEYQGHVVRNEGYQWHQILYCADGDGFLIYDNKTEEIHPGDYFFIPANYASEYYGVKSKWDVRWVAFAGDSVDRTLSKFGMPCPIILRNPDNSKLEKLFEKMISAQLNERMISDYICSGLIYEYLLEFHLLSDADKLKEKKSKFNILLPAIVYIENNLDQDISIDELAAESGISHQHLCRIFRETMNIRPVEYIMKQKIEKSKEYLRDDTLTISQISALLGFSTPGYFSTAFKQYEGITPNSYRKIVINS